MNEALSALSAYVHPAVGTFGIVFLIALVGAIICYCYLVGGVREQNIKRFRMVIALGFVSMAVIVGALFGWTHFIFNPGEEYRALQATAHEIVEAEYAITVARDDIGRAVNGSSIIIEKEGEQLEVKLDRRGTTWIIILENDTLLQKPKQ